MRADTRKILAVASGSVSQIGIAALAGLVTTIALPVSDRGRYVLLITVLSVTAPLAGLGSNVGVRRLYPRHRDPGSLERSYLRLTAIAAGLHGALIVPLLLLFPGTRVVAGPGESLAVLVFGVSQVLSWQFVELWYARGDFKTGATFAAANAFTALLGAGAAIAAPSLLAVVTVQALSAAMLHTVQAARLTASAPPRLTHPPPESTPGIGKTLVRIGLPSLVMTAGMALTFRLDRLILGALSGSPAVAVYALSGSFSELPRFIPASFGQIANGKAASTARRLPLRPYLLPAFALTVPAAVAAGGAGYLFMHVVNGVYQASIWPMLVLLAAELALVPYSIVIRMILGGGRINLSAGVGVVALLLSASIYWVAIRQLGLSGAALGSLVVYAAVSVSCLIVHRMQKEHS